MSPEEFWRWFIEHEGDLFVSEGLGAIEPLREALSRVDAHLLCTIGPIVAGKREIEIRAPREQDPLRALKELARTTPHLPRWVLRLREPGNPSGTISFDGITLQRSEVRFSLKSEGERAGIVLYMPGYTEAEYSRYLTIAFQLLDGILGESTVESALGTITMETLSERHGEAELPVEQLPRALDSYRQSARN